MSYNKPIISQAYEIEDIFLKILDTLPDGIIGSLESDYIQLTTTQVSEESTNTVRSLQFKIGDTWKEYTKLYENN